jgi:tetratricopeptide (TPR) repeat protein
MTVRKRQTNYSFLTRKEIRNSLVSLVSLFFVASASANGMMDAALRAQRSGDNLTAAKIFYQVVTSSTGEVKQDAEMGLAHSLKVAGFPYAAAFFYSRLVNLGPRGKHFRGALESLSDLNSRVPLGRAGISGLFQVKADQMEIPPGAKGFYHYYKGLESFDVGPQNPSNLVRAKAELERVPAGSPYYSFAQFYLGIIYSILKNTDSALDSFKRAQRTSSEKIRLLATINLGRVYYERKEYRASFENYSKIPRDSDLWLQGLFEGAYGFFMIQKHNNTLGNLHTITSPFFERRFYPETYILQAITYLRLCRVAEVDRALKQFQDRYKPKFSDLNRLLKTYKGQSTAFYDLVASYSNTKTLKEFTAAVDIVDAVSRTEAFKEGQTVVRNLDREKSLLRTRGSRLDAVSEVLKDYFSELRTATAERTGQHAFDHALQLFRYLQDLSNQTRLINIERQAIVTDTIREEYQGDPGGADKTDWGEGMRPLNLKQQLEYWPFEGEYWEDELGAYVFNIDSKCNGAVKKGKSK